MECLSGCGPMVEHSRLVSIDRIIINHRCGRCGLEVYEAQPNDTTPPSPLCVKCGKPAERTFYCDVAATRKANVCTACYNHAIEMPGETDEAYNWLTGKDAPRPEVNPWQCTTCGGIYREHPTSDCFICDGCGQRMRPVGHKPAPSPVVKATTCCARGCTSEATCSLDSEIPTLCATHWKAANEWQKDQDLAHELLRRDLDRPDTHAAWVRKQYQRAVDVPIYGTGGPADTFDPRRK